jgi:hypothetical protein
MALWVFRPRDSCCESNSGGASRRCYAENGTSASISSNFEKLCRLSAEIFQIELENPQEAPEFLQPQEYTSIPPSGR